MNCSQLDRHRLTTAGYLAPMPASNSSSAASAALASTAAYTGRSSVATCLGVVPGDVAVRGPKQVHHAGPHGGRGPGRLDRVGQASQAVAAHDQHVTDASVAQLSEHPQPVLGALAVAVAEPGCPARACGRRDRRPQRDRRAGWRRGRRGS